MVHKITTHFTKEYKTKIWTFDLKTLNLVKLTGLEKTSIREF